MERGRSQWTVLADQVIGQNTYARLSVASIEQPDGFRFEQYVLRMPRGAMTVVLDDAGEQVLLIWRHRFVTDRWVWELPGGHVEDGEDDDADDAGADGDRERDPDRREMMGDESPTL